MSENRLREIRKGKGLAGMGVAARAGVSHATVIAIEKHSYLPVEITRRKIADALGVSESDIWPELAAGANQEAACVTA